MFGAMSPMSPQSLNPHSLNNVTSNIMSGQFSGNENAGGYGNQFNKRAKSRVEQRRNLSLVNRHQTKSQAGNQYHVKDRFASPDLFDKNKTALFPH